MFKGELNIKGKRGKIILREKLINSLNDAIKNNKIVYVFGQIGIGKTEGVLSSLEHLGKSYRHLSCSNEDFIKELASSKFKKSEIIIIDDYQEVREEERYDEIIKFVLKSKSKCIILSRSVEPSWMKPYIITSQINVNDMTNFIFDKEDVKNFYISRGIMLKDNELELIQEKSNGWVIVLVALGVYLERGVKFNKDIFKKVYKDIYETISLMVFDKIGCNGKIFLMTMAYFENFDLALAKYILKDIDVKRVINEVNSIESILNENVIGEYTISKIYSEYLKDRQSKEFSNDEFNSIYNKAGDYYMEKNDLLEALKYYNLTNNRRKIKEILIINSKKHPGIGNYFEMDPYYLSLTDDEIRESIYLMSGMSMAHSLYYRVKESEYWMKEVEKTLKETPKHSLRYMEIEKECIYLNIAIPHRGSKDIKDVIVLGAKICMKKKIKLREVAITSNLPSMMNGGKDFCNWSKYEKLIYKLLKIPIEIVLGESAAGMPEVCVAESKYEKSTSDEFIDVLVWLNSGISSIQLKGTIELNFAAYGLMARVFASQGNIDKAEVIINNVYERAINEGKTYILKNIEAFKIRQRLLNGDIQEGVEWLANEAPDETKNFFTFHRYLYLLKIRVQISQKRYFEASSLILRLKEYYERYYRTFGTIECNVLYAITLYRMGNEEYKQVINSVIESCREYSFIRVICDEGSAVLDVLLDGIENKEDKFINKIINETRKMAKLYPNYLETKEELLDDLTKTEIQVLKLIYNGVKNNEISEKLYISLSTVKFHASNIYSKLGVKNRVETIKLLKDRKITLLD